MSDSVKVAVRVRPFNQREIDRNAKLVIEMKGNITKIINPNDNKEVKTFTFDYSYWSHDGFMEDTNGKSIPDSPSSRYASQDTVFQDLGRGVLDNAQQGYNCSLFAYGQTGSGKSYSMVGYEENKGIVPITCNELFKLIKESSSNKEKKFQVSFSMLEIYNERVRDLLNKEPPPSGGLSVKQRSDQGFYVQDLKKVPVANYEDIEKWMNQGTKNRTIAATQMNATSSRAHTVITVEFKQIITTGSSVNTRTSVINLIDLAGSERASKTGATGDRLKEGASINKSLSSLGNVIAALADLSSGKKNILVPYRDSVLTKLLKNALGGNSKTVMIAALSPADINYEETLSTLRYADRAKRIKNKAIVNENPLEKMIRELREENERLKKMLQGELPQGINTKGMTPEEIEKLRKEIADELKAEIEEKNDVLAFCQGNENWDEKVANAQREEESSSNLNVNFRAVNPNEPRLVNINQDPQLSGILQYSLSGAKDSALILGKESSLNVQGPGIHSEHATVSVDKNNAWWIEPKVDIETSSIRVNGVLIVKKTKLEHGNRIMLGSTNLYVFIDPSKSSEPDKILRFWDYDAAMKEVAEAEGYTCTENSPDIEALQAEIIEILPMVHEVNAISNEMDKLKQFQVVIIPAEAQDVKYREIAKPKLVIKMINLVNGNTWVWEKDQFVNRRYIIQEIYEKFLQNEDLSNLPCEQDPFWEPDSDILVGHASLTLMNLCYNITLESDVKIIDYKGRDEGLLNVEVIACDPKTGEPIKDDNTKFFVDEPRDLLMKPFHFQIKLKQMKLFKPRFIHGSKVKFRLFYDENKIMEYETPTKEQTLEPNFNFTIDCSIKKFTQYHLDYFANGLVMLQVYGIQKDSARKSVFIDQPNLLQSLTSHGIEDSSIRTKEIIMEKKYEAMSNKINKLKKLCIDWAAKDPDQQEFEGFYKSVAALAFSSGNKFKVVANVVGKAAMAGKYFNKSAQDLTDGKENSQARITIYRKDGEPVDGSDVCLIM